MFRESCQVQEECAFNRQKLIATKLNPGGTINNFVTCLKTIVKHCYYGDEEDNQVRDIVISHLTNRELRSKF